MDNKLSMKEFKYITLTIFGMFFGAGNLIFPSFMGKLSGYNSLKAIIFFSITAVVFPMLGVIVAVYTDGLENLTKKVDRVFMYMYPIAIYLSIGPGLAIPRAGSTPYSIGIEPFIPEYYVNTTRLIYTIIFFTLVYLISLKPSKLVESLGKYLTPLLIFLIIFMYLGLLIKGKFNVSAPLGQFAINPYAKGFLEGYNTMDALASLVFGTVVLNVFKIKKIENKKSILTYVVKASIIAGFLIIIIYTMLTYIGASSFNIFPNTQNGAEVLSLMTAEIFGKYGVILLTLIFIVACLSVSIGLTIAISNYFVNTIGIFQYREWSLIFTLISLYLANKGLTDILRISIPILLTLYPVTLVLIVLPLLKSIHKDKKLVYVSCVYITLIISIIPALEYACIKIGLLSNIISKLPLVKESLPWLLPALITFIISVIITRISEKNEKVI